MLLLVDLTSQESFHNLPQYLQEVDRYAIENVQRLIIGTKADLVQQRQVSKEDFSHFCESLQLLWAEVGIGDVAQVENLLKSKIIPDILAEHAELQ